MIRYDPLKFGSSVGWLGSALEIKKLGHCIERSQLGLFGHLIMMPPGYLPSDIFPGMSSSVGPPGWQTY